MTIDFDDDRLYCVRCKRQVAWLDGQLVGQFGLGLPICPGSGKNRHTLHDAPEPRILRDAGLLEKWLAS